MVSNSSNDLLFLKSCNLFIRSSDALNGQEKDENAISCQRLPGIFYLIVRWIFLSIFIVFIHMHAFFTPAVGTFKYCTHFSKWSTLWDILWQIGLGYEVFPNPSRTKASIGKLFPPDELFAFSASSMAKRKG